jgi:archaellum component FlaC
MEDINEEINKIHNKIDALILSDNIRKSKKELREEVEKLKKMALDFGYYQGIQQARSTR